MNPDNKTAIPKEFGSQEDMIKMGKNTVSLTTLGSKGQIWFYSISQEMLLSLSIQEEARIKTSQPTYSVNVVGSKGKMVNNLQSIAAATSQRANATGSNSTGSG